MANSKIRFISLGELNEAIRTGDFSKITGENEGVTVCSCNGNCNQATVEPKKDEETKTTDNSQSIGSIYSMESLQQALAQEQKDLDDATIAFTRLTNEKNARIEQLKQKIELEKAKTRFVRKGSDMAITMTKENAENLMQQLSNLLNGSQAENVTFNIGNLG